MKQTDRVWHWNSQKSGLVVLFGMEKTKSKNTTKSGQFQNQTSKIVEKGEIDSTISQIRTDLFTFRDWYRQINKKWRG